MSTIVRNTMPPIVNAVDVLVYIRIIEINTLSLTNKHIYRDRYGNKLNVMRKYVHNEEIKYIKKSDD